MDDWFMYWYGERLANSDDMFRYEDETNAS